MSSCELTVVLDEPERAYRGGDSISGRVLVRADGEVTCKKLVVEQIWRTHGRGNIDEGTLAEQIEVDQRWLVGQVYELPFSFLVPNAPISHEGNYVNVDHYVTARADLPWKMDPRGETDYRVAAGPGTPERYVETKADFQKAAQDLAKSLEGKKGRTVFGWVLLILFTPLLIVLAAVVVVMVLALLLLVLPFALIAFLFRWIRQSSAERKLGAVQVEIPAPRLGDEPGHRGAARMDGMFGAIRRRFGRLGGATYVVNSGSAVPVVVRFTPKSNVKLDRAVLSITAIESARSGTGTNATTHTNVLVKQELELGTSMELFANRPTELRGELPLPPDAPPSFKASNNKLAWEMKIALEIAQWPDWVQKNELLVVPASEG